ncbi:MAG TPA: DEAD/DEAH box helicase family protein, partial [Conexibacter sp.]|nr:DEAD/DEAH box helicase family protein [Conexibacter sp.]
MSALARRRPLPAWPARRPLRAWQQRALDALAVYDGEAFLASATPAAGKTTFGLRAAYELLEAGRVQRVAILAPTAHIARQWAADAARYG